MCYSSSFLCAFCLECHYLSLECPSSHPLHCPHLLLSWPIVIHLLRSIPTIISSGKCSLMTYSNALLLPFHRDCFFQILIYFYIPGVQHFKANDDYEVLRMDGWLNIALAQLKNMAAQEVFHMQIFLDQSFLSVANLFPSPSLSGSISSDSFPINHDSIYLQKLLKSPSQVT